MGGREGQVKRQHGTALRRRDALEPGCLGSDLSPGPSWPLDLSGELEEEVGGRDGGYRNLVGIAVLFIRQADPGKPRRNIRTTTHDK